MVAITRAKPVFPTFQRKNPLVYKITSAFPFAEGAISNITRDICGNGFYAKAPFLNGCQWVPSRLGYALHFNSSNNAYMNWKDNAGSLVLASRVVTANECTFAVWVKPTGAAPAAAGVSSGDAIVGDSFGYIGIARGNLGGTDAIRVYNFAAVAYDSIDIPYNANEWVFVVLVHSKNVLYGYKNGRLVGSTASNNTGELTGSMSFGFTFNSYLEGCIGACFTWKRGISPQEVKELYHDTFKMFRVDNKAAWLKTAVAVGLSKALSETITVTESELRNFSKVITDSIATTETIAKSFLKVLSDTVTETDTIEKIFFKVLTDNATIADTLARSFFKVLSESVIATPSLIGFASAFKKALSVGITFSESTIKSFLKVIVDSITTTETISFPGADLTRHIVTRYTTAKKGLSAHDLHLMRTEDLAITTDDIEKMKEWVGDLTPEEVDEMVQGFREITKDWE